MNNMELRYEKCITDMRLGLSVSRTIEDGNGVGSTERDGDVDAECCNHYRAER